MVSDIGVEAESLRTIKHSTQEFAKGPVQLQSRNILKVKKDRIPR